VKKATLGLLPVQGHSRSPRSVSIESPYACDFLLVILTDILSRTVSKLSQIVQISDTTLLSHPLGEGLGALTYTVHLRLVEKLLVDFPYDFLFVLIGLIFATCYG